MTECTATDRRRATLLLQRMIATDCSLDDVAELLADFRLELVARVEHLEAKLENAQQEGANWATQAAREAIRREDLVRELQKLLADHDVGDRLGADPVIERLRALVAKYEKT